MKIFVAGASGLVGSNVVRVAERRGHEVTAAVGRWSGEVPGAARVTPLDGRDIEGVQRVVLDLFPDAIVNAAAISDPAACDANPDLARRINVDLPRELARLAHHLGARLVHLSSEQVFDGTAAPYSRNDTPAPVNLYGRQKLESEQVVAAAAPETGATLRLPLLAGNSLAGNRSLHERLFSIWSAGGTSRLFTDEIRQPCSAGNVAEVVVEILERRDITGLFHWAGAEAHSRAEMGERIARHFNLPAEKLIEQVRRIDTAATAARQPDLSLDLAPLKGRLKTAPESFDGLLEKLVVPPPAQAWFHQLGS